MRDPALKFTAVTLHVHLFTVDGLKALTSPELNWRPLARVAATEPGPFAYVLTNGDVVAYPGKSDSLSGDGARRAAAYPKWVAKYAEDVAQGRGADPMFDPVDGDVALADWSAIVRLASRYNLTPLVASLAGTGETGGTWEARVKALCAIFSGLESLGGGSVWEVKADTLRNEGYMWAVERVEEYRNS